MHILSIICSDTTGGRGSVAELGEVCQEESCGWDRGRSLDQSPQGRGVVILEKYGQL